MYTMTNADYVANMKATDEQHFAEAYNDTKNSVSVTNVRQLPEQTNVKVGLYKFSTLVRLKMKKETRIGQYDAGGTPEMANLGRVDQPQPHDPLQLEAGIHQPARVAVVCRLRIHRRASHHLLTAGATVCTQAQS